MQRLDTDEISQYTSVHQYQVEDASPGTHCLQPPHCFPLLRPATGDETDSSDISAQLDGVFIITTQQGSDRGRKQQRERWRSGGSNGGGEELRLAGEEDGGRMNIGREGSWVLWGAEGEDCAKVSVCFFSVCVFVDTINTRWRGG